MKDQTTIRQIKSLIREVPDFPKPGILFYDISTLLQDPDGFRASVDLFTASVSAVKFDIIAGIESRGFIFAGALADRLNKGLILVRKKGKLPGNTRSIEYDLEYGHATIELTDVAISKPGTRVLLVDDLLATGGTAAAACRLISESGGVIAAVSFLIELNFLNGRKLLSNYPIHSLLTY